MQKKLHPRATFLPKPAFIPLNRHLKGSAKQKRKLQGITFATDLTLTTTHTLDEQQLAADCHRGDRIAQRRLYETYVDFMMITCLRYIPSREDAKEVMLDGFVNAYKNIDRFEYRGSGSLKAWLKKIMVNQCLMFLRKKNNVLAQADEIDYSNEPVINTDAIAKLSMKELMQLIHELPDGYRTVFNLNTFEGMTHKEIGILLNISENTSKSQLRKAKTLLQKTISSNAKLN